MNEEIWNSELRIIVGKRLKSLRESKKLTQKELADKFYMKGNSYGMYESGKNRVPLEVLVELSKYYEVSTDYILGLSDRMKGNDGWSYKRYVTDDNFDISKYVGRVTIGRNAYVNIVDDGMGWSDFQTRYLGDLKSVDEYLQLVKEEYEKLTGLEQEEFIIRFLMLIQPTEKSALQYILSIVLKVKQAEELIVESLCTTRHGLRRLSLLKDVIDVIVSERIKSDGGNKETSDLVDK